MATTDENTAKDKCQKYWNDEYWRYVIDSNRIGDTTNVLSEKYAEYLKTAPNMNALDVGCGLGGDTAYLLQQGFTTTSTDFSETALSKMRELVPNATTLKHDTCEPFPFEDNTFGVIVANLSLHYFDWETTKKVFAEMQRMLAPSGLLIGRVNSNKSSWLTNPDTDIVDKIEPDFFWDGQKCRRFFNQGNFEELTPSWKVEILKEDVIARLNDDKKAIWEFILRSREEE